MQPDRRNPKSKKKSSPSKGSCFPCLHRRIKICPSRQRKNGHLPVSDVLCDIPDCGIPLNRAIIEIDSQRTVQAPVCKGAQEMLVTQCVYQCRADPVPLRIVMRPASILRSDRIRDLQARQQLMIRLHLTEAKNQDARMSANLARCARPRLLHIRDGSLESNTCTRICRSFCQAPVPWYSFRAPKLQEALLLSSCLPRSDADELCWSSAYRRRICAQACAAQWQPHGNRRIHKLTSQGKVLRCPSHLRRYQF